jgi:eukaryotic-like serine/threonine-protein kinase
MPANMTPERWEEVKSMFHRVRELNPEKRSSFLDHACSTDQSLRREVESLLSSDEEAQSGTSECTMTRATLTAGSRLGECEVQRLIGTGGMGEVYLARDTRLGRDVAIKVLPDYFSQDPDRLRRFEQEARAAAALNHPNILAVFQMGTHQGAPYLVSELLEGGTLREQLVQGPMPLRKAINLGVQIARGLAAAHQKGIAHRDLKPDNLFVTKDGRVKILDFGLAKLTQVGTSSGHCASMATEGTEPGVVMGTVGYMAPEQVKGEAVDQCADIFSFGSILYEMLTGKRAFQKPTSAETMSAILNEEPADTSQIVPSIPSALQHVLHRCLEKCPEQRFQSASDVGFALEALSSSGTPPAAWIENLAWPQQVWMWIAVGMMATLIAGVVAWWSSSPRIPEVISITQLTNDDEPKWGRLATDGPRIYFNEGSLGALKLAQVSVAGGQTGLINTSLTDPHVLGISADGSSLLVLDAIETLAPLWEVPLPAGEPRRLGELGAYDADIFPDGRVIVARGNVLAIASKDGSNLRTLMESSDKIQWPEVAPGSGRISFTVQPNNSVNSLQEINPDGTGAREVFKGKEVCCGTWTVDGRYLVFEDNGELWALPRIRRFRARADAPLRISAGPISYSAPRPSRDGKRIFAIGSQRRGELVRYDAKSQQFVPYISGISAIDATFSTDGKWVAYLSYPDHILWRSRSDGETRQQLTDPSAFPTYPRISPDGTKVAFGTSGSILYVAATDYGTPRKIAENVMGANWSPDGHQLIVTSLVPGKQGENGWGELRILDLQTGKFSTIPNSRGMIGAFWPTPFQLVASTEDKSEFRIFDLTHRKWATLAFGRFANWFIPSNGSYLYCTTAGAEPKLLRIRLSSHRAETITALHGLRRILAPYTGTWLGVSPDGSPVFTRDVSVQEIYALDIKWP